MLAQVDAIIRSQSVCKTIYDAFLCRSFEMEHPVSVYTRAIISHRKRHFSEVFHSWSRAWKNENRYFAFSNQITSLKISSRFDSIHGRMCYIPNDVPHRMGNSVESVKSQTFYKYCKRTSIEWINVPIELSRAL